MFDTLVNGATARQEARPGTRPARDAEPKRQISHVHADDFSRLRRVRRGRVLPGDRRPVRRYQQAGPNRSSTPSTWRSRRRETCRNSRWTGTGSPFRRGP
ncbi:hypothetical protein ACRAWF_04420 [Streptomyces sp. L7]